MLAKGKIGVSQLALSAQYIDSNYGSNGASKFVIWEEAEDGPSPAATDDWRQQQAIIPSIHYFSLISNVIGHGIYKSKDFHSRVIYGAQYIYRNLDKFELRTLDVTDDLSRTGNVGLPSAIPTNPSSPMEGIDEPTKSPTALKYGTTTIKDCDDCPEVVIIPRGKFTMGSKETSNIETPAHQVEITKSFSISRHEITQRQWKALMGNNPSHFKQCGEDCPVDQVSWNDTQEYLKRLTVRTGVTYRLPSESEWEYACRAGSYNKYCGSENKDDVAWYKENSSGKPHPVGKKKGNAFGIFDMSGNLSEWVMDCSHGSYKSSHVDEKPNISKECKYRIFRGGSYEAFTIGEDNEELRPTKAISGIPTSKYRDVGFRVVRSLPQSD